jgi:hypothetical protein
MGQTVRSNHLSEAIREIGALRTIMFNQTPLSKTLVKPFELVRCRLRPAAARRKRDRLEANLKLPARTARKSSNVSNTSGAGWLTGAIDQRFAPHIGIAALSTHSPPTTIEPRRSSLIPLRV